MKLTKKIHKTVLGLASVLFLTSCGDFLNLIPKNERIVSELSDVKTELLAFWAGHTYSVLPIPTYGSTSLSLMLYNDVNALLAIYEDNLNLLHFNDHGDITQSIMNNYYYQSAEWKSLSLATALWRDGYGTMGMMNAVIDDLNHICPTPQLTPDPKLYASIKAEAHTLRAWTLLKLMEFFTPYDNAELGLPVNLDTEDVEAKPRLTQQEVYDIILNEVKEAEALQAERIDFNFMYSPYMLDCIRAELYLYKAGSAAGQQGDWEKAEAYSAQAIEGYKPETSANMLRGYFEADAIGYTTDSPYYGLRIASKRTCRIGNTFTGIWGKNNAQQISDELYNLYQPGDIRLQAWFVAGEVDGVPAMFVRKPTVSEWGPVSDLTVIYRKAELYLANAEAKCRLGKTDEAEAMLLAFRQARIPGYGKFIDKAHLLDEIVTERRCELCYENGTRFVDMKRLGLSISRQAFSKKGTETEIFTLEPNDYRYTLPIPAELELDYNNIEQNPGWGSVID